MKRNFLEEFLKNMIEVLAAFLIIAYIISVMVALNYSIREASPNFWCVSDCGEFPNYLPLALWLIHLVVLIAAYKTVVD